MSTTGVYAGIVVSASDPQNRRRARLRIPQISGTTVSGWAEPVSIGTVVPGDQVSVAFEGGDLNFPLFWPRFTQGLGDWQPLIFEPGWVTSDAGEAVARATGDGMIELHGSMQTSNAISLGANVKAATLPAGLRPLHRVRHLGAGIYRTAYKAKSVMGEYRTTTTTTSTAYVTDPNGPTVTFVAPGSGQVIISWGSLSQNTTAAGRSLMSTRVSLGSTVLAAEDDNRSAETQSTANSSTSMARIVSGLTPGTTYTVTTYYRTTDAGTTATFDNKWVVIDPVYPYSTPSARVTLEPTGEVYVLFPDPASAPFDLSLSGIRARIM
ncbi:phage baseplate assembly protein V [Streptomyces sp. NPDC001089]